MAENFLSKNDHISIEEYKKLKEKKPKYKNKITEYNGVNYSSKLEASFAFRLDQLKQSGAIQSWIRQVTFVIGEGEKHVVDFLVFHRDGSYELIEIKGRDLPLGRLKRKDTEEKHGVKITVLTRKNIGAWRPYAERKINGL